MAIPRSLLAELARRADGPRFDLRAFCGDHAGQLSVAACRDPFIHIMCARQSGKSWICDGILMDNGFNAPASTNLLLGLNGPAVKLNNWVPVWKRQLCGRAGIPDHWHNETDRITTFPNGSRVCFAGTDDLRHVTKFLGNRLANGVIIIDEAQSQPPEVLKYLLTNVLPPMLTPTTRVILAGVLPDVPAGRFYELAHPPGAPWPCTCKGWRHFEWGRAANVHTPEAMDQLKRYMELHALTVDDPQIQRDWYMQRVWDTSATAYRYRQERNGYRPRVPSWLAAYDWESFRVKAAEPHPGITNFTFGIDPGGGDRTSIVGWGWGDHTHEVQQVFEAVTPRDTPVPLSEIASTLAVGVEHYPTDDIYWDPGSGSLEIDTFGTDYGIPLVKAANKTDFPGQVRRNNDLLTKGWLRVIIGSALEEDYQRARFDSEARGRGQWKWSSQWHPDPSEAARYALAGYWSAYVEPEQPKSYEQQRREAWAQRQREQAALRSGVMLPEMEEAHLFDGEEDALGVIDG